MRKIERLKKEALKACKFRGHTMRRFSNRYHRNLVEISCSKCKICGMKVVVDDSPAPNGIEIGGEAVALHCSGK